MLERHPRLTLNLQILWKSAGVASRSPHQRCPLIAAMQLFSNKSPVTLLI